MRINPDVKAIDAFTFDDFELVDYDPTPRLGPISV